MIAQNCLGLSLLGVTPVKVNLAFFAASVSNMIVSYAETELQASLATKSHINTVSIGGHYDGCLGILAGIEVA